MKNRTFHKILIYALLVLWAVIVLFPFYWMVLTSVKSYSAYNSEYVPSLIRPLRTTCRHSRRFPWRGIC